MTLLELVVEALSRYAVAWWRLSTAAQNPGGGDAQWRCSHWFL